MTETFSPGLAGVTAGLTSISEVDGDGGLRYRGYDANELAQRATFEEVAWLLIRGELPSPEDLRGFVRRLHARQRLPSYLRQTLERLPGSAHPMDVFRTACSEIGCREPENQVADPVDVAETLIARTCPILLYWDRFHRARVRIQCRAGDDMLASQFLYLLHGHAPDVVDVQALNAALVLYAEHEFNASTFSARVTASTRSDFYSAVTSAIGTLRGPLHGGANEETLDLLMAYSTPQDAESGILQTLDRGDRVPGFGHPVYRHGDPRSRLLKQHAHTLAANHDADALLAVAERIEHVMANEQGLFPNLGFYSALAFHLCGIPRRLFTAVFAMARIAGWSAHILEQREANVLIRPVARYRGAEPRAFVALSERG